MTTNASPQFTKAQEKFLNARNDDEKLIFLEEMIRECPKHKSSENMLANLKTRRKKLEQQLEKKEKNRKTGKTSKVGIKKEGMQVAILGKTNTGKSSLLAKLTNASPKIAEYGFSTREPHLGMLYFEGITIQLVDLPPIDSEYFDRGIPNNCDVLLEIVTSLNQIKEIEPFLEKATKKRIIIFNKADLLSEEEKRKIDATLRSKKYTFVIASSESGEGIQEIKNKLFQGFDKIRIYTKEPKKEKSKKPIILEKDAIVKDVAEKILKGFSRKVKETKIWGPSSKFPGQKVGLTHKLLDLDVVEFKTK